MERTSQIGIGLVVLAALAGGVYFKAKQDQKIGTVQTTNAELPAIGATDDLDKISITNADKGEIVLEKKGDKWEVEKPVVAEAHQANVKSLVDNLKELKATDQISQAPSEDMKKDYSFDPAKAVHVVAYKGADKKVDVTFGKSGARGQMAMIGDKPGIYLVSGYSSYLYTRELKGFRNTEIFKFDDANANQLTVENKNGVLSFTKGDKWAGTAKGKPIANLDEEKVKDAIRAFKALNADGFGDGKTPAETGLDNPEAKITISLKDNAGTYKLNVGKVSSGTERYAQKEGDATVYTITSYISDWALAEPSKFEKSKDAGAAKSGPTPMEMPPGLDGMGGMGGLPPGHPDIGHEH